MSAAPARIAVLEDRGVVSVTGPDAAKLLGGLITNDIAALEDAPALYAGLLAPQGKIVFDFLVVKTADGFLLDTAREKAAELVRRLSIYKLRAAVEIRDVSDRYQVAAIWGEAPPAAFGERCLVTYADPRLADLGARAIAEAAVSLGATATAHDYHVHRIGLGVPEGGKDFLFGDAFPHEALFDQLHGISFTKGCYVGQEVVSRMQHRGTARKRIVTVLADRALPARPLPVLAGEIAIGGLGSVAGPRGLALLRLDRVAQAQKDGIALTVDGVAVRAEVPFFATFRIEAPHGPA